MCQSFTIVIVWHKLSDLSNCQFIRSIPYVLQQVQDPERSRGTSTESRNLRDSGCAYFARLPE